MNGYPALYELSTGESYPLDKPVFLVGRSSRADLPVMDLSCSRRHFQLVVEGTRLFIEPVDGVAATTIDGRPISHREELSHGQFIEAGEARFQLLTESNARPDPGCSVPPSRNGPPPLPLRHDMTIIAEASPTSSVSDDGFTFDLSGRMTIGRDMQRATIHLPHVHVSRLHAEIQVTNESATITDLNSANGTFVNGVHISEQVSLADGDRIDIGPYSLVYAGRSLSSSSRDNNVSLVCRNLTQRVQARSSGQQLVLLDDVSLAVKPKEFVCVLGPSGSGKTTLLSAMSARAPALDGTVLLNGVDLYENFESLKQDLAVVPQKDVLHDLLSVQEALWFTGKLRLPPDTSAEELADVVTDTLETVGLQQHERTMIRNLSGGQIKRASLANEIIAKPSLLFLDEVTSGLDEQTDREMMDLFRQVANTGKTVVCVTHSLTNVERVCDLVVILANGGKLAFVGAPREALSYFEVERLGDVYERLQSQTPDEWRDQFQQSPYHTRYVQSRIPNVSPTSTGAPASSAARSFMDIWPTILRQSGLLLQRLVKIKLADRRSLAATGAQSVLVAVLIVLLFGDVTDPAPSSGTNMQSSTGANIVKQQLEAEYSAKIIYLMVISCIWFGCNNAAKEIVKERSIYARERDVNLHYASYLMSKLALLGAVGIVQATVLIVVVALFCSLPGNQLGLWCMLVAMTVSGVSLGLLISATARSEDMAVTLVPILLIPQMILAGMLAPLSGLAAFLARMFTTSYWGYQGAAALLPDKSAQLVAANDNSAFVGFLVVCLHILAFSVATGIVLHAQNHRYNVIKRAIEELKKRKQNLLAGIRRVNEGGVK